MERNFKETQQDLTELNGDGNRERGRYGEDESNEAKDAPETEEQRNVTAGFSKSVGVAKRRLVFTRGFGRILQQ